MSEAPARCPRCDGGLLRLANGELCCLLAHGTVWSPERAGDLVEVPGPQRKTAEASNAGRPWSPEDEAYVLAHLDEQSASEMAAVLGRTERAVHHWLSKERTRKARVARLSPSMVSRLANASPRRRWTKREDALLLDLPTPVLLRRLAQFFPGRTKRSVVERRRRLLEGEWALRESDGLLTSREVARVYRCHHSRVLRLIRRGVLQAERAPWGDWRIDPADCEAPVVRRYLVAPPGKAGRPPGRAHRAAGARSSHGCEGATL